MAEGVNTPAASPEELRERLRQLFVGGEFGDRVRDFAGAPSPGRPLSLFRRLDEILADAAFAELRSKPVDPAVYAAIDALDLDPSVKSAVRAMGNDPQNAPRPSGVTETVNALRALLTWAENKPGCMGGLLSSRRNGPASAGPPRIEWFEAYRAATRIEGASPGEAVRVVGSGFSNIASENEVRFQGTPALVVKAAAGSLVVVVPAPGFRAEPQGTGQRPKPVFVTGDVEVSVATRGGTARSQFRVQPLRVKHGQPERDLRRVEAAARRTAQLVTKHADAFRPLVEADETGAVRTIVRNMPVLFEEAAKFFQTTAVLSRELGKAAPECREFLNSLLDPEAFAGLDKVEADLERLLSKPAGGVTLAETTPPACALEALINWVTGALEQWVSMTLTFLIALILLMAIFVAPYLLLALFELYLIAGVLYTGLLIYLFWCMWHLPPPGGPR